MFTLRRLFLLATGISSLLFASAYAEIDPPLTYEGKNGPGKGYHIVLLAGDEEYRSEEALPQLARILAQHHGFKCTVLFSIDKEGLIDPAATSSIDHPQVIEKADLLILSLRFRNWPDKSMKYFKEAIDQGIPMIGLRTSTHAFNYSKKPESHYAEYSFRSKSWEGGFGRQILGETWVAHHGKHNAQGTRAVLNKAEKSNVILNSVSSIFGKTDVYTANPPEDSTILLYGAVTETLKADSKNVEGKLNTPMQPIAWTREIPVPSGEAQRVFTTTMGSSQDLLSEDLRRLLVNASYWALELEEEIPKKAKADIVGEYKPTHFGVRSFKKGARPASLAYEIK